MTATKSQFQKWKEQHAVVLGDGSIGTTLEQQVGLALHLREDSMCGKGHNGTPPTRAASSTIRKETQHILQILRTTPLTDLVSWDGIHVGWFLDVFCKTPYMQRLLEFGCELWFVRKVCIVVFLHSTAAAGNKKNHKKNTTTITSLPSGPFVTFVDKLGLSANYDTKSVVQPPTVFVSYTGAFTLQETLDALRQLDPDEVIWMDILCVNQFAWTGKSRSPEMKRFKDQFLEDLKIHIQLIDNTALIVGNWRNVMATLGQIWVLWEIFCTAEVGAGLCVLLPPQQINDFVEHCLGAQKDNLGSIVASLASIDANQANAEDDSDRKGVFAQMQAVGLSKVNHLASVSLKGWLCRKGLEFLENKKKHNVNNFEDCCLGAEEENLNSIIASLASIDVNQASAEDDSDRKGIFARMQAIGLSKVNHLASVSLRGWLYRKGLEFLESRNPNPALLHSVVVLLQEHQETPHEDAAGTFMYWW